MTALEPPGWPSPVFEGSEKRIEVDFSVPAGFNGLRGLDRPAIDLLMQQAACCVVSARSNTYFDAYVLSESSLFVYPDKFVLKTCGTTQLLNAVPLLLELAASLGCQAVRCKYSRASFLFPEYQPTLYHSFAQEVAYLDAYFAGLGSSSHVLGHPADGLQWHVYVAGTACAQQPTCSLEICMTQLDAVKAQQFFRCSSYVSAEQTTEASGIRSLVPLAAIDDYVFEPCGYSMNSQEGRTFSTIHITPEAGFSYASFEISCFAAGSVDVQHLVARLSELFIPGEHLVCGVVCCAVLCLLSFFCN
eukprot:jgi/Astpho2/2089/e_gw1.00038.169.1_t